MIKRLSIVVLLALVATGCATGKNYKTDADAANSKTASLQNQLNAKNQEIASLQDQLRQYKSQLNGCGTQLELAKRAKVEAEGRLYQALDKLAQKNPSPTPTSTKKVIKSSGSYVK